MDPNATSPTIAAAEHASKEFFAQLTSGQRGGRHLLPHEVWAGNLEQAGHRLDNTLLDFGAAARSRAVSVDDDFALKESLEQAARRAEALREDLEQLRQRNRGRVNWMEIEGEKVALSSTPVDLGDIFQRRLFETVPAVALLSATLSTDTEESESRFSFVRSRLGILETEAVEELSVPSPFAYEKNCVLYLPKDLPRPGTDAFLDQSAARIAQMAEEIDGGTFVLTTSNAAMRGLSERIRKLLSARLLLVQGERPKEALLSAFRANGAAVLVATASFWEGIDVPGDALRLVVLEKIPFSVPTDPVFEARGLALEEAGKNAFMDLAVPQAALTLKQGFGRLIRRESDVGVVALLDERVHTKGYGKRLLRALPPASVTSDWSDVRGFAQKWAQRR